MDKKSIAIKLEEFSRDDLSASTLKEQISYVVSQSDLVFKKNRILKIRNELANKEIEEEQVYEYLLEFSNWFFFVFFNNKKPNWLKAALTQHLKDKPNAIKYHTYHDFFSLGWTIEDVMISAISISNDNIDNYSSSNEDLAHWIKLREQNLSYYIGIEFCGEIIGHLGLVILTEKEYLLLKKGEMNEEDIQGKRDDESSSLYLYVSSIVVKKEFRNLNILKKLLVKANRVFFGTKDRLNRVQSILAIAYTEEGSKVCRSLGFDFIQKYAKFGEIYEGTLDNIYKTKIGAMLL